MLELLVAKAQIALAAFYGFAFFAIVLLLIFQPGAPDEAVLDLLKMLLGALVTLLTQQSAYFFARQRAQPPPPPDPTP